MATLGATFNELPVLGPDGGEPAGWLPPYRAREDFGAALADALPDDVRHEIQNGHTLVLYRE